VRISELRPSAPHGRGSGLLRLLQGAAVLGLAVALSGCNYVVMSPSGDVAVQQKNLIIASTALMLLVIVPVIALTFLFAWRYRATNEDATYDPEFHHSTQLEVVIWTIPLLIIIALGAMTWMSTHTLDPYRPLSRLGPNRPIAPDTKPLEVQVVSLDWKWLFIYPEYGIASVNEMAAPVDRPITFKLTSSSVWNTFYVPALAGMIYTMPGMQTQLQAVINKEGDFWGLSGHYSGSGFSRMNFRFHGVSQAGFDEWVRKARAEAKPLDRNAYLALEKPSEAEPVRYFGQVENGLYDAILGMCVEPGRMCVTEMHHIDRRGGDEANSRENAKRLDYDNRRLQQGDEAPGATVPASGRPARSETQPQGAMPRDSEGARGGVNAPQRAPDGSQGNAVPGADRTPAPAQLNTAPAQRHQH
jgi:cytochrome o ubiquinol oxidase subunit II